MEIDSAPRRPCFIYKNCAEPALYAENRAVGTDGDAPGAVLELPGKAYASHPGLDAV